MSIPLVLAELSCSRSANHSAVFTHSLESHDAPHSWSSLKLLIAMIVAYVLFGVAQEAGGASLTGQVTDASTGLTIADAQLKTAGSTATTDSKSNFSFQESVRRLQCNDRRCTRP